MAKRECTSRHDELDLLRRGGDGTIACGNAGGAATNKQDGPADHGGLGSRNRPGLARISKT